MLLIVVKTRIKATQFILSIAVTMNLLYNYKHLIELQFRKQCWFHHSFKFNKCG